MAEAHSVFEYLYRDASNYKAFGTVLLVGLANDEDRSKIEANLTSDGVFVPEFVGLKPLQAELDGFPSCDDHLWHEYVDLRSPTSEEMRLLDCWGRLSALADNFVALPPWGSEEMYRRVAALLETDRYSETW